MLASTWVNIPIPTVITAIPVITILPGPILSASTPATGMVSIAPMPWGASSRPDCSAVSPRTSWKYSGNSRLAPKKAIANSIIAITATVMFLFFSSRSSISGWMFLGRSAHGTNATIRMSPRIDQVSTLGSLTVPASGIEETPYRNIARPGDSSSMPTKSKDSDGSTWSRGSTNQA